MATEKLYIAKLENGEEIGPADQEVLIKLAENGTITATTMVRSKLIPEWDRAGEVDFLKAIIFRQQQEKMEEIAMNQPFMKRLMDRITLTAPQLDSGHGIVKTKVETLPAPSPLMRFLAGLTDFIIVVVCVVGLFIGAKACLENGILTDENAVYVTIPVLIVFVLMYFTLLIAFTTQTIGQRCWGMFLIRSNGKPFWIGRVFFYSLLTMIFGLFTPIFLIIGTKTYPELLTGTRFAKVLTTKKR